MSGIGIAVAAGVAAGGSSPLTADLTFSGTSFSVAGASGSLSPSGGMNLISVIASGGTPPYTDSLTLSTNPSGKISLATSGDGVHQTLAWSGFALSELENCVIKYKVTDSLGATATAFYPASGNIVIQRTS